MTISRKHLPLRARARMCLKSCPNAYWLSSGFCPTFQVRDTYMLYIRSWNKLYILGVNTSSLHNYLFSNHKFIFDFNDPFGSWLPHNRYLAPSPSNNYRVLYNNLGAGHSPSRYFVKMCLTFLHHKSQNWFTELLYRPIIIFIGIRIYRYTK